MPTIRRVIAVILCVYAAGNALWLWENQNRCVGSAYHARHFMRAAQFYNLAEGYSPPSKFYRALHEDRFYPAPLHSLTSAVGMTIFGKNVPLVTGFINFLYFAASLMFLAILAAELGYPPAVAAWALILYALYPAVYGMSRLYGAFDFQVAAMTPLAAVVLLRTRQFASRRHCLILAAVAATGLLIKDTFALYFGAVFLLTAFQALRGSADRRRRVNILILLGTVAAAVAIYYAHPVVIYKELTELLREPTGSRYLLDDWRAYTLEIPQGVMSWPFFLFFLGSLFWLARRRPLDERSKFLLAWIVPSWAIICLMPHYKQPSYFVPILPAAALVSAAGLCALSKRPRTAAAAILLSAGIAQYGAFSFGLGGGLFGPAYFQPEQTVVFSKGFPVEIDPYQQVVARIVEVNARERRENKILVLQAYGHQTSMTFYHFFNWLHDLELESSGGVAQMFEGSFLEEHYDKVLLPIPETWDTKRYLQELHAESRVLAKRAWLKGAANSLEKTTPESFEVRLERFLAQFPVKEEVGRDGTNVLWLLSRRP